MKISAPAILLSILTILGCAPSPTPSQQAGPSPASGSAIQRPLVIAMGREIDTLGRFGDRTDNESHDMVQAGLVVQNQTTFSEEPWMAEEVPATEKGTWQVNPDGTMVTTYRLRPNIKWHDGTPFSPKDFAFGLEVSLNDKVASAAPGEIRQIERLETPDERTLVIHWRSTFSGADRLFNNQLIALPRHIIEDTFRAGDYERFNNSPVWGREFIGTGPYRVLDFQPGVVAELQAFEGYFLGKPKIERVTLRVIPDNNAMLTNVLSGEVHVTLRSGLTLETGLVARDQWEAAGHGSVIFQPVNWQWVNLSGLNPWFDDVRVRRALLHAIDREAIVQTLSRGVERVIHAPIHPNRPQFPRADAAMTKYEYSQQRAEQLLDEAGWRRGPDGVRVNGQGERLVFDARTVSTRGELVQLQAATIGYWNTVGARPEVNNLIERVNNSEEYRSRWPGANWASHNIVVEDWLDRYHSRTIPSEATRWRGDNVSRWANPQKDAIIDEMVTTLDRNRRDDLIVEFIRLFTLDLPHLPLNYTSEVTSVARGLVGVHPRNESGGQNSRTWNIHQWEWRA